MNLVPNWKSILLRGHSSWSIYLGIATLFMSDLIWLVFERDTDPRYWIVLSFVLLAYGLIGRVLNQGVDDGSKQRPRSALLPAILALGAILLLSACDGSGDQEATSNAESDAETVLAPSDADGPADAFDALAVAHIGKWEGLRLEAYFDIVGVVTVCYGETKGVKITDSYTKAECDAMLAREVASYRERLHAHFTPETLSSRLPVARDVAYTSLAYNAGVAAIAKSTAVRRLNDGNINGGCEALTWWNKAGGRVVRGLVRRRTDEHALCMRDLIAA